MIEFAYINGYYSSLNMIPFKVLYGHRFRTPMSWDDPVDRIIIGPDILK